uniref:Uncharacterized protein n=1 Tax=Daphnia galeata TaxID=27404 RepID=A0A8J2RXU8_9CRUS|nr:unnamed protein product [Daphnia galeata]
MIYYGLCGLSSVFHLVVSTMSFKWLFQPASLVLLDLFLGIASFCFQVAFLSSYVLATNYDLVGTGIWAGIIFIATAGVAWQMDGKVDKLILAIGPCLSFICGIILFSLNIASLSQLDQICPIKSAIGQATTIIYRCSTEIGLDVGLMLCGLIAIPVNAMLILYTNRLVSQHSYVMVISTCLLSTKLHARTNVGIGILCFIFQIASLATSPSDVFEQIGIGFWGGMILIATGVFANKASERESSFLLGCSFILSIFSFLASFSILSVFAASIVEMKQYSSNPCTGYVIVPPGHYMGDSQFPIPPCSYYSSAHLAFDSILLICGLIGIPANTLLTFGVIKSQHTQQKSFIMPTLIPASLLNIKVHSVTNLALGLICFIFQIAALATSPSDVFEQIGIGFWGGLILMLTALTAYKASTGDAPFLLGCSFVLSIFAFMVSFSIMCIFAASIDEMKRYSSNPCTGYFTVPPGTNCNPPNNNTFIIPPCSHYSSAHLGFDSVLLTCGLIGIPVNVLLVLGIITVYNPAPAATA